MSKWILLLLAACSQNAKSQNRYKQPESVNPVTPQPPRGPNNNEEESSEIEDLRAEKDPFESVCQASLAEPLKCVEAACRTAGGEFNSSTGMCRCLDSQKAFTSFFDGQCIAWKLSNVDSQGFRQLEAKYEIEEKVLPPTFSKLSQYQNINSLQVWPSIGNTTAVVSVLERSMSIVKENEIYTHLAEMPPAVSSQVQTFKRKKLETVDGLTSPTLFVDVNDPYFPTALKSYTLASSIKDFHEQEFLTHNGCAGVCKLVRKLTPLDAPAAEEILWISGGYPFQHQLRIVDQFNTPTQIFDFDASGKTIFQLKIINFVKSGQDVVNVYNLTNFNASRTFDLKNHVVLSSLDQQLSALSETQNDTTYPVVFMCEGGNIPLELKQEGLLQIFRRGPQYSLWGWLDSKQSAATYYSASHTLSSNNIPEFQPLKMHSAEVAKIIVEDYKVDVAPIGIRECQNLHPDLLKFSQTESTTRVINISSLDAGDPEALGVQNQKRNERFHSSSRLLWVTGAGNDAMTINNPKAYRSFPQSYSSNPNLIVVGASGWWSDSIADYSNRGAYYVDMYAEGSSSGGYNGTSFAAPRVARVAAKIASLIPSIPPWGIRHILMVSVDANLGHFMAARSGGKLNEKKALKLAEEVKKGKVDYRDVAALMRHRYCKIDDVWYCKDKAQEHLNWIQSH